MHSDAMKAVLKWFDKTNTLGGWDPAFHSDNKVSRFCWLILFLSGSGFTLMAIQQTVQQYFMFQTKIMIEQFYQENGLVLPAVTICNSNRVHCGNLYQEARKAELVSFLIDNLKQIHSKCIECLYQ